MTAQPETIYPLDNGGISTAVKRVTQEAVIGCEGCEGPQLVTDTLVWFAEQRRGLDTTANKWSRREQGALNTNLEIARRNCRGVASGCLVLKTIGGLAAFGTPATLNNGQIVNVVRYK